MDATPRLPVAFRPRAAPLVPVAVAACGAAAFALAARLAERDDAALARLSGVGGEGLLVVIGEAADLPWVDGVVYLGRDPGAPALLLPTALEPDVPAPLFERAILAHASGAPPPVAVIVGPAGAGPLLAGTGGARPIRRGELLAAVEGAGS